jgi:hypothetical protein
MIKPFIVLCLFVGMFMIVHGVYEQKLKNMEQLVRTEYRFVPRTLYDEVMSNNDVTSIHKNFFDSPDPWYERNIGVGIDGAEVGYYADGSMR